MTVIINTLLKFVILCLSVINLVYADIAEDVVNHSTLKTAHEFMAPEIKNEIINSNKNFPALAKVWDSWFSKHLSFINVAPIFVEKYRETFNQSELEQLAKYDAIHKEIAFYNDRYEIAKNMSKEDLGWYSQFLESSLYLKYRATNDQLATEFPTILNSLMREGWEDLIVRMKVYEGLNPE